MQNSPSLVGWQRLRMAYQAREDKIGLWGQSRFIQGGMDIQVAGLPAAAPS
jgi:hypothetical protein